MEVDSCLNEATPLIEIDDSELADELDEMESLMFQCSYKRSHYKK